MIPGDGTNPPSRTLKGEKTPRPQGEHSAVRIYFREIGQYGRIQAGDAEARQEMILSNLRFVANIALNYEGLGLSRLNLLDKLGREPTNRELAQALGVSPAKVVLMRRASLDSPIGDESYTHLGVPDRELSDKNISGILRLLIGELLDREMKILTRRFGLDGEEVQTLEEIGHRFGITREWIRQLQNAALAKLRKMLDQLEVDPQ